MNPYKSAEVSHAVPPTAPLFRIWTLALRVRRPRELARRRAGPPREVPAALALVCFPFAAGWANFVLDTVDGDLLIRRGSATPATRTNTTSTRTSTRPRTTPRTSSWWSGVEVARPEVDGGALPPPDGRTGRALRHAGRVALLFFPNSSSRPSSYAPRSCTSSAGPPGSTSRDTGSRTAWRCLPLPDAGRGPHPHGRFRPPRRHRTALRALTGPLPPSASRPAPASCSLAA